MSKKEKDQHPLAKGATAVLTGMVGAAAFHRLGGSKLIADGVPKLGKFLKTVSDDLSDMTRKEYNAKNLTKLYNKHIADDDSTWKSLKNLADKKHTLDIHGNNAVSALVKLKEIQANTSRNLKKVFNADYADEVSNKLYKKYGTGDETFKEQLDKLVTNAVERKNIIEYQATKDIYKIDEEAINKFLDVDNFLGDKKNEFFEDLLNAVNDSEIEFKNYKDKHTNPDGSIDFIKNITDQFTAKNLGEAYGTADKNSFFDELISGQRAMTFGDYYDNIDKFEDQIIKVNEDLSISLKDTIKEFVEENEEIRNILIDAKNLKINTDNEIINYKDFNAYKENISRGFAGTLPGKIFKITDFLSAENPGIVNYFTKNKSAHLMSSVDGGTRTLNNNYIQIMNKYYKIDKNNGLTHMKELDDMYSISMKHGSVPRMMNKMFGLEAEYIPTGKIAEKFDIGTTTESTIIGKLTREDGIVGDTARKIFGGKKYNIIDRMKDVSLAQSDAIAYRKNLNKVDNIFSHIVKAPNMKTLSKMENFVQSDTSKDILRALQTNDQEEIVSTLSKYTSNFKNKDLKTLIMTGAKDREKAAAMLSIKSDRLTSSKQVLKYTDMVKREAFKEVLLGEVIDKGNGSYDYNNILLSLRRAGITGSSYENAKNIAHWGILQKEGSLFNYDKKEKGLDAIKKSNQKVIDLLTAERVKGNIPVNAEFVEDFRKTIDNLKSNYSNLTTSITAKENTKPKIRAEESNAFALMRKAYTPGQYVKDMLRDLNDFEKMKANSKKFSMQFVAGRNNPEYVTTYTMTPYFFTQRLIEPFNEVGLGFSNRNMGSVGDQWKAIMGKRVLPTALGITAFSYLNFETKNLTGTSITGAMAQGVANVDLGLRKIADATGIGSVLNAERRLNPLTQYWFSDDYQDYHERKDYYENGYDEVRKGRWWAFGSASEFRGGKISYFQPNFVKRANSNWKDVGLYGSVDEKWKHSWIPTLRHPFAPIRRALDPYWLERKHYEDRPYLETAPLFSQGTPWGAVLNPTLGEMIKPIRKMHRDETRRGFTDPRTLIAERNERLKAKAVDKAKENLISISDTGVSNVTYTPKALADPGKAVMTLSAGNGKIQSVDYNGVGYVEGLPELSENEQNAQDIKAYVASRKSGGGFIEGLETTALGSFISNEVTNIINPISIIQGTNQGIMQKASAKADGSTVEKANLAKMPFKQAAQRLQTKQDESDLLLTTSKHDFISDALFSGKQLGGMYGFLSDLLIGDQGRKLRPENANKMASFTTGFWDANIGGLGGGVMEIARRFFPHDDHNWTDINPIRNTMPDWMPEKFKVGDPYRKVNKGEMRLPGAGYETIHKLRSDEYGKYGALDRMRILADIAPWSDEYKLWRDVAKKTVTDAAGQKEMEEIKKRVEKQSRSHEFYKYKFLATPTEIKDEIVDTVDGKTITTTSGKQYTLAGLHGQSVDASQFLQSGMSIKVEHLKKDSEKDNISAAIYSNGMSVNKQLVDYGLAKADMETAMGAKALTGQFGHLYGAAMEAITHAPIPFVHSKVMKIDTPLESYKNERVYGTPYSTWEHPIRGFISPAFQKSWARGPLGQGLALGSWALAEHLWGNTEKTVEALKYVGIDMSETGVNKLASVIFNTMNPGAFAGSMMAAIPTGLMGESGGLKGLLSTSVFGAGVKEGVGRNSARLGATAMIAGYAFTRSDKPLQSMPIFSLAGAALAKQLDHPNFSTKEGAIVGAATGLLISAIRNPRFDKDKMFGKYVPESTERRWDLDEYFDRLEYIKYMGLYEKSARKARWLEGTNIKKIINSNEALNKDNQKKLEKLNKRLEKVRNSSLEDSRKEQIISRLNSQIYELSNYEQVFKGGKYTKAAVAYKQAADSTIYGLKEGATSQQVLRAISKGDKDFFMEFAKETDKKKRKEILKYVSPYQRRALQIAWGEKNVDKVESNSSYFKNHALPGVFWAGWSPTVDMENVKIKTIENEGMLLSDFGIYDSQKDEIGAITAPTVGTFDKGNTDGGLGLQARLQGALNGCGLLGVKVSVSPTSASGIEVVANITNAAKITEYKMKQGINKMMGTRLFY